MNPIHPTILLATLTAVSALAQGTFRCANRSDGDFGPPFEAPLFDRDGVTQLTGSRHSVQFYAGPLGTADENLAPVGPVVSLAASEGLFDRFDAVAVPGVPAGQKARVQMRVWDNESGTKPTWESATVRGSSAAFDSLQLSPPNATGFSLTPLRGLTGAALLPALAVRAPAVGVYRQLFANSHYQGGPGFSFSAASVAFREFAADGRVVIAELTPGTNPEPLYGPLLVRRNRLGVDLAHEPAVPAPLTNGVWAFAGVSADGSVIAASRWNGAVWQPKLIRQGVATDLPARGILSLSSDARYALVAGEGNELRRLDLHNFETVLVRGGAQPNADGGYQLSHAGRVALLGSAVWREGDGSVTALPAGFAAARLSGDGRTVVGSSAERPAYWTAATGLVGLHANEPGVVGALKDVSFDGSVLVGWATTPTGRLQVWTREGKTYRVAELLPNGSNLPLASYQSIVVERVSHDGRTVYGSARYPFRSALAGLVPTDAGWVADLVFPGDGARLTVLPTANGVNLTLPAPSGFRYQFEHSSSLGAWSPVGEAVAGDGATLSRAAEFTGDAGFFRVVTTPE